MRIYFFYFFFFKISSNGNKILIILSNPNEILKNLVKMHLARFTKLFSIFRYKLPLRQSELPINPDHVDVSANVKEFSQRWLKAIQDQGVSMIKKSGGQDNKFVNIWPVLLKTYGQRLLLTILFGALHSLIGFVNPVILDR